MYALIYVRGTQALYTWRVTEVVRPGALVWVQFRHRQRLGLIISLQRDPPADVSPEKILPIKGVLHPEFLPESTLALLSHTARTTLTPLTRVLSHTVPEAYFRSPRPVERTAYLQLSTAPPPPVRGQKQQLLLALLAESPTLPEANARQHVSQQTITSLLRQGVVRRVYGAIAKPPTGSATRPLHTLTPQQQQALEAIKTAKKPVLLYGVTGSGKTEVYKRLCQQILQESPDAQVLVLVPEIALTPQMVAHWQGAFGAESIAVFHSNRSPTQRLQSYERLRTGEARILIGTRSAIFVPLPQLRQIIIDEEHEWTYSAQQSPRYVTQHLAEFLHQHTGCGLLLGSATPRAQSLAHVLAGRYQLVELPERISPHTPPAIELIDMRLERRKGNESPLSQALYTALRETLNRGEQAVLFLNKRGMWGVTFCVHCGAAWHCPHCDTPMKLHEKGQNKRLICHLCGTMQLYTGVCPACHQPELQYRSYGTQAVEQYLQKRFPGVGVLRADADTTTHKQALEQMLEDFGQRRAQILLGTQMITKGLDYPAVTLVGILQADTGLYLPDFRAEERVYQLCMQVAGRSGRHHLPGQIFLQTFNPEHPLWQHVLQQQPLRFLRHELALREQLHLPPTTAMAKLTLSHTEKATAYTTAKKTKALLEHHASLLSLSAVITLAPAFFPRTHGRYHFHIFITLPSEALLLTLLEQTPLPLGARVDIHPVSIL